MNKRMFVCLALVASLSMTAVALPVVATFDTAGTQAEFTPTPFTPFNLYVIGKGIGDVVGWEMSMVLPAGYTVLNRTVNNGPGVNPTGDDNYIIGLGNCFGTTGEDYLFITYNMGWFDAVNPIPSDAAFCLEPADAPSPPAAGFIAYVSCSNEIIEMDLGNKSKDLGIVPDGCALLNPTTPDTVVKNEMRSWGAVKASY